MLVSKNPRTGDTIGQVNETPVEKIPEIYIKARAAQKAWAAVRPKQRARILIQFRECIIKRADELIDLIAAENGKPKFEALANDLIPAVDTISYFAKKGPKLLKNKKIKINHPVLLLRKSYLNFWPVGVVAVISPWNFPFFLPVGEIVMALIAGNAVVFKPSEVTPVIGQKIGELLEEAGLPPDVFQIVQGGAAQGQAVVEGRPDKIFFTGSVATGKKVSQTAAQWMIPVNLELGGKDAMLILPDADLDFASSAALWGGLGNSGQTCASVERLIVHEKVADEFVNKLGEKVRKLRIDDGSIPGGELGYITYEKQKEIYRKHLAAAKDGGAKFLTGGKLNEENNQMEPTIVSGPGIENLPVFNEETFGPMMAMTTYKTLPEAIAKANKSQYGLTAAVIADDMSLGEDVARQLEVGTVTINEVGYTAGVPETPWGGVKDTGLGRKHSDLGLLDYVHVRHIHRPRFSAAVMKSFWWFPYTKFQYATFRQMLEVYRRNWIKRLAAIPMFLWNFVNLVKKEPRH